MKKILLAFAVSISTPLYAEETIYLDTPMRTSGLAKCYDDYSRSVLLQYDYALKDEEKLIRDLSKGIALSEENISKLHDDVQRRYLVLKHFKSGLKSCLDKIKFNPR